MEVEEKMKVAFSLVSFQPSQIPWQERCVVFLYPSLMSLWVDKYFTSGQSDSQFHQSFHSSEKYCIYLYIYARAVDKTRHDWVCPHTHSHILPSQPTLSQPMSTETTGTQNKEKIEELLSLV